MKWSMKTVLRLVALTCCGGPLGIFGVAYVRSPDFREYVHFVFPRYEGILVGAVGMPLDEMRRRSTFDLGRGYVAGGRVFQAKGTIFDFELADSSIRFRRCRMYSFQAENDRVQHIELAVSPKKLGWREVTEEMKGTVRQLRGDGWQPGVHENAPTEEMLARAMEQEPEGSLAGGPGHTWHKNGVQFVFWATRHGDKFVQNVVISEPYLLTEMPPSPEPAAPSAAAPTAAR
jgi:hypothetical protein